MTRYLASLLTAPTGIGAVSLAEVGTPSSGFLNPFHGIKHPLLRYLDVIRKLTQGESLTFFRSLNPTNPYLGSPFLSPRGKRS